jgi:hypothetical protein
MLRAAEAAAPALDVLNVECTKCTRKGHYHVQRLIEVYGRKGNMSKWFVRPEGQLPEARCTQPARTLRPAVS